MNTHPAADLFPLMDAQELEALADDIAVNGLIHPVVTFNGEVLDGRNRLAACDAAKVEPRFVEWLPVGDVTPTEWVIATNLTRRHLNKGQLATLAVELLPVLEEEARKRQVAALRKGDVAPDVAKLPPREDKSRDQAGAIVGVSGRMVSDAKKLKEEEPELFEEVKAGKTTIEQAKRETKEKKREERRAENAKKVAAVEPAEVINAGAKFATIVIDPPWDWNDEGDVNQLGRARPDYASMSIEKLASLPVEELADSDCHIYLWITNRSLPKGFELLGRWGFRYITAITWVKPSFGMGNYFRGQTEHILFGVRGSQMLKRKDAPTVFNAPRGPGGHSSKPPEFLAFVESCSPGPYVEMFSRSERDGWTGWGENT